MAYSPSPWVPMPPNIGTAHYASVGSALRSFGQPNGTSTVWPTANLAIYVPLEIDGPFTIVKFGCYNGAAVSGNIDLGIYDETLAKVSSTGSTAQASINAHQTITLGTAVTLVPGRYWMAMAMDNTTGTNIRFAFAANALACEANGIRQQTSAFPLPSTAVFAVPAQDYTPHIILRAF